MKYYLAVDIGASSGRHIVGWTEGGELKTEEVYRFPNGVTSEDGHLTWDIDALTDHVKRGIAEAKARFGKIESLSVDTWGVDYVLLRGEEEVRPCYAYRDHRTEAVHEEVHAKIPFSELYRRTGIQFQLFNTVYQLFADRKAGRLEGVTDFLMMPEYLLWKLCGVKSHEYTNATTGGMVSAVTGEYDPEIIDALGLPRHLFRLLDRPGTVIGEYEGIRCVLCASHDTASAVEGIPMTEEAPYISSGTWSLLGVKTPKPITDAASENANYSNEGGVGYNRYQKNIMGMWLANRLRGELCPDRSWSEIVAEAEASSFSRTVDANADAFLSPVSMKAAFDRALGFPGASGGSDLVITNMTPEQAAKAASETVSLTVGDYFRCAYRSLALSYRRALEELEHNTGRTYETLYIVGGGAKNTFLNRLTEEATGKTVIALPIEATALGNLKIQMGVKE
ncbi:MAG: rhamnulokinase [Lachnospiraceae bacterium]|nr:rhamnulokinase [Lachnospiraceae bacterium]